MTPKLIKSFEASAEVAGHRIVAIGAGPTVAAAAGATAALIGITDAMGADAGKMCDVVQAGWAEVVAGDDIEPGDLLTSDATGRAVPCAPEAGETRRTIAIAMADASEGDIIPVLIAPGVIHEPEAAGGG